MDKKYIITSNPVVIRQAVVYAKNEKDAWDLYWGKNSKKGKIELQFIGNRPTLNQINFENTGGELDAIIRELAYNEYATLITADKVQSLSAKIWFKLYK